MANEKRVAYLAAVLVVSAGAAHSATNTWDAETGAAGAQDGSGIWTASASDTNWWDGVVNTAWNSATPDSAVIGAGSGVAGTITLGETLTIGNLRFNAPGSGSYTLNGNGYALNFGIADPLLWVASGVTVTNGANSASDTCDLDITGGGTIILSGTNSFDSLDIADADTNNNGVAGIAGTTLTIPSGASLTTDGVTPGVFAAGFRLRDNATLNVSGMLTCANTMGGYTSEQQYTININPGAVVTNKGNLILGWNTPAVLNMNGGTMTVNGNVYHMDGADGATVNLNGGALEAARVFNDSGNGNFLVNFNGGTLRALGDNLLTEGSDKNNLSSLRVQNGGVMIDSNGKNIEAVQAFAKIGSGGMIKQGSGTLTFSGGSYTGATSVTAGTLNVSFNKRAASVTWGAVCDFYRRKTRLVLNGGNVAVTGRASSASVAKTFTVGGPYNALCARGGNTAGLVAGMPVSGLHIPTNTFIAYIKDSARLMLSKAATNTTTAAAVSLTFGSVNDVTWQTIDNVELQQSAKITVSTNAGPGTTLSVGAVTGGGSLTKDGSGTLALSGTNTYGGATLILGGTLQLTRGESAGAVSNASFETHGALANGNWGYTPAGTMWSITGGGIAAPGSAFVDANAGIDGAYVGFIQQSGSLSTTLSVPAAGLCVFSFLAGNRPNYPASALSVDIDGTNRLGLAAAVFNTSGDTFTGSAVLSSGMHTLTFKGTITGSDSATWIDRVAVTACGHGGAIDIMPTGTVATVSAGAVLDLNGNAQTLSGLRGGGLVTNGTLTVRGVIDPGATQVIGTLTVAAPAVLAGTLLVDVAVDGSGDLLKLQGNLDLTGLALQIRDKSQLQAKSQYVIASCAPGSLTGSFASTNLTAEEYWHVAYDNAKGEVRLELRRGALFFVK